LRIVIRPAAKRDMVRYYSWLVREAGAEIAERFMAAADRTFTILAESPHLGAEIGSHSLRHANLRKWKIEGFRRMVIVYQPDGDCLRVVRVFNTGQDWWSLLDLG
jgi:plasmid stabilization system protein ParE